MGRKPIIAGNWKMNNTIEESLQLAGALKKQGVDAYKVEVIVAPPFTSIKQVFDELEETSIQVAGQNLFWEDSGAFTGEVSARMLKQAGCKWVIIGHSERRQYFGETDVTVGKRLKAALTAGLKAIMCVGETLEEREARRAFDVLDTQVAGGLEGVEKSGLSKIAIAYEPVWAIGTGKTATSDQADEAHARIRGKLEALYGKEEAQAMRILYGGSVKPDNAKELLSRSNVDGALVGGASLKAGDFTAIISAGIGAVAQ
ncbi:Triosephosphate isomerase [hydrothermal vent metagenome]|uniref:triose-phosphate isomerase n=1 Tax=hydrothermal vent metagenome TaxID=652676 RepID=A0A3B1BA76_9ZZZZ